MEKEFALNAVLKIILKYSEVVQMLEKAFSKIVELKSRLYEQYQIFIRQL